MIADIRLRGLWVREVQYLLLVASEASWLYPWSLAVRTWIFRDSGPMLDLQSTVVVLLLAVMVTRLAVLLADRLGRNGRTADTDAAASSRRRVPWRSIAVYATVQSVVVVGVLLAGLLGLSEVPASAMGGGLATVGNQLFNSRVGFQVAQVAGLAGILWWRGLRLGRVRPGLVVVVDEFLAGLVAISILLVLFPLAAQAFPAPTEPLMVSALAFVCTGLVGIPLARLMEVSQRPRHRGNGGLALGGCWLALLFAMLASLLASSLFLAQLLSFDRIGAFWEAISGPLTAVLTVVVYVASRPFDLLAQLLTFLLSLLPSSNKPRPAPTPALDFPDNSQNIDPAAVSPELILGLKVVVVLALVVLLIWLLVKAISRLGGRRQQEEIEETRDSVWTWPSLATIWRWLLRLWQPLGARVAAMVPIGRNARGHNRSVRELYAEFQVLAATLGQGRRPPETPLEYERRLFAAQIAGTEEVRSITEAYIQDRYAPPTSGPTDLSPLAAAVERLRALWKSLGAG